MQILLIRHGESEADILNVHEGRADFPLTALGRKQVKLMAEKVKQEFPPYRVWASTLKRASETAAVLADTVGCPIQFDQYFSFGCLER
jgi:2,3-bisphosphoglycerate-dependent phosphoglycerate mutase